jgi:hypothetical protein
MKLKGLLIAHAIIALVAGIVALLIPDQFISWLGPKADAAGLLVVQYGGVWLIGIGLLAWFVRDVDETEARSGITFAFFTMSLIALIVAVLAQIATTPVFNGLGWVIAIIQLLLVLGYGYSLLAGEATMHSGSLTQHPQH